MHDFFAYSKQTRLVNWSMSSGVKLETIHMSSNLSSRTRAFYPAVTMKLPNPVSVLLVVWKYLTFLLVTRTRAGKLDPRVYKCVYRYVVRSINEHSELGSRRKCHAIERTQAKASAMLVRCARNAKCKSAVSRENSMLIAFKFPAVRPYRSLHRIDLEILRFH
jgi:hypothetical protein